MTRLTLSAVILVLAASVLPGAAAAGEFSAGDRAEVLTQLAKSERLVLAATNGLTEEQWTFRPAAEKWTIAECVEHIVLAEELLRSQVLGLIEGKSESVDAETFGDGNVLAFVSDRSRSFDAPSPIQPTGRFTTPRDGIEAFLATRAATVELVETTEADLRSLVAPFAPAETHFDGVQWLLFLSGHAERHRAQIEEVKRAAEYPSH